MIQEETMLLQRNQACFRAGVLAIDALMVPSTKPSLFLALRAIYMDLARVGYYGPTKG